MKLFVQAPIGPQTGLAEIDVIPDHTIGEIKWYNLTTGNYTATVALMYGGIILDENSTISRAGIPENAQLALMPYNIIGGIGR